MLYNLLVPYAEHFGLFNLLNYITVRCGGALITALVIGCFISKPVLYKLQQAQIGADNIREDVPESHRKKSGTPSIGGVLILLCWLPAVLLWADLNNRFIWGLIYLVVAFAGLGFYDDYRKLKKQAGIKTLTKLFWQGLLVIPGIILLQQALPDSLETLLVFPIFKDLFLDFGLFYLLFMALVVVGSSNAVNFTDGLDGLAIGCMIIATLAYMLIAYVVGNAIYADYLQISHVVGSGEVAIFCSALIGAGLVFLWFNAMPADVFMGDTGSLPLGAALGGVAIATKHELQLLIIGGLFVMEAGSVILQIASFRMTGGAKRIFKKAPLHHHFEEGGMAESKVTIRFWILAAVFALLGLASLKLR